MNKVSLMEIVWVSVAVTVATAVLFTPYLAAQVAAQDAWISVFVAGAITLIPAWATGVLMAKFPKQSLIEIFPKLFGPFLGKLIGLLYAGLFLFSAVLAVWRLEVFTARFLLPETPLLAIRGLFLLCLAYSAFSGTVPLIRTSAYIVPAGMVVIVLVTLLPAARMEASYLFPLFEFGYRRILDAAVMLAGWLCQIPLVIFMFNKYVQEKSRMGYVKKVVLAIILSTFALELGALGALAAFGPVQTASMYYPAFEVARIISLGTFLEHIEVIFVAVWIAGIFVAAAFYVHALTDAMSNILNFRGKVWKTVIIAATILALVIWPFFFRDLSFLILIVVIRDYGAVLTGIFGGVLPLVILARAAMVPRETGQEGPDPEEENNGDEAEDEENEKSEDEGKEE